MHIQARFQVTSQQQRGGCPFIAGHVRFYHICTFHGQQKVLRPERKEAFLLYHSLCTPISHLPRH